MKRPKVHASLFSGIGGPEVAAAMLGWDNAFHCEINPFGRKVLEYWFPKSVSYDDITKTNFKEWRGKVDILTGGFPCQPFSYAGKRGGREDERYLWPEMCRAIQEIRPSWVIGENVAGITTMVEGGLLSEVGKATSLFQEGDIVHGYELEQSFTIERICSDLERIGYSVQPMLIPAAAVGAPHRRDRIFILAHADTDRTGLQEPQQSGREEDSAEEGGRVHHRAVRPCEHAPASDTYLQRRDERFNPDLSSKEKRQHSQEDRHGFDTLGLEPGRRWRNFPTVSAVHRGNDGIPFRLDDLTISQSKWRTESLKAYGNAIVPQVMYRIFQAIDKL